MAPFPQKRSIHSKDASFFKNYFQIDRYVAKRFFTGIHHSVYAFLRDFDPRHLAPRGIHGFVIQQPQDGNTHGERFLWEGGVAVG